MPEGFSCPPLEEWSVVTITLSHWDTNGIAELCEACDCDSVCIKKTEFLKIPSFFSLK